MTVGRAFLLEAITSGNILSICLTLVDKRLSAVLIILGNRAVLIEVGKSYLYE